MSLLEKNPRPIDALFPDRRQAMTEARCLNRPIGCGEKVMGFKDPLSAKEYGISGLCQKCQDKVFGGMEE